MYKDLARKQVIIMVIKLGINLFKFEHFSIVSIH